MAVHALPCDSWSGGGTGGGSGGHATDIFWNVGAGKVLDQTEFVLELVLSSTNTVIATIDSVGTLPNTTSTVVPHYGTEPNRLTPVRSIIISSGNVGKEAYIRLSPRRYGTTPLGLQMRQIASWFNWSAAFQRDTSGNIFLISASHADSIASLYFNELIDYCDSVKTATGSLPEDISGILVLKQSQDSVFKNRYFDQHSDSLGRAYYTEKVSPPKRGLNLPENIGEIRSIGNAPVSIMSVIPQPVSQEGFEVSLTCVHSSTPVSMRLMPIFGGSTSKVWEGVLKEGKQSINIYRTNVAVGVYYLAVYDVVGNYLSAIKIVLQ